MNVTSARTYLLGKPEAWEDFPFTPDVAVMKIDDKMFATLSTQDALARMNLKCDPHEASILREIFPAVLPGYHMNKRHWNTVVLDGSIPQGELQRMMDNSYALVLQGAPSAKRKALELQYGREALYPAEFQGRG